MRIARPSKTLLVGGAERKDVERRLKAAGCAVLTVNDGVGAITRARREMFDAAVLVSTGDAMDLMETIFNLKDIRQSMRIIVLRDARMDNEDLATIPNVQCCSVRDLQSLIE